MDPHERLGPNQSAKIEAECLTTAQSTAKMQVCSGSKSLSVNDLGEQRDLSKENPEVTQRLLKMLQEWRQETDAKMPYPKTATSKLAPGSKV